jgi:hypothetical protein
MAAAYVLTIPQHSRFLLSILPIVGLLGAMVVSSRRPMPHAALVAVCVGLLLPGWLYAGLVCLRRGPLPTTPEARQTFLLAEIPGYGALDYLNRRAGDGYVAYGLHLERLIYYSRGKWLGEWAGPARFDRILPLLSDRRRLEIALHALGAQYFVAPQSSLPAGFVIGTGPPVYDRDGYVVFALGAGAPERTP